MYHMPNIKHCTCLIVFKYTYCTGLAHIKNISLKKNFCLYSPILSILVNGFFSVPFLYFQAKLNPFHSHAASRQVIILFIKQSLNVCYFRSNLTPLMLPKFSHFFMFSKNFCFTIPTSLSFDV